MSRSLASAFSRGNDLLLDRSSESDSFIPKRLGLEHGSKGLISYRMGLGGTMYGNGQVAPRAELPIKSARKSKITVLSMTVGMCKQVRMRSCLLNSTSRSLATAPGEKVQPMESLRVGATCADGCGQSRYLEELGLRRLECSFWCDRPAP